MTAMSYAPTYSAAPVLPWRGKPAYRGPLVVIPGGRAAGGVWRPVLGRLPQAAISRQSADAAGDFRRRLSRLPAQPEIRLDVGRRLVRVDGSPRRLTPREFDLLAALAAQPGEPIAREALLRPGGGGRLVGDGSRTVDVHIAHLREKLALPGVIATIRGRGYALNPAFRVELT